jgi:hypothetical protein
MSKTVLESAIISPELHVSKGLRRVCLIRIANVRPALEERNEKRFAQRFDILQDSYLAFHIHAQLARTHVHAIHWLSSLAAAIDL